MFIKNMYGKVLPKNLSENQLKLSQKSYQTPAYPTIHNPLHFH